MDELPQLTDIVIESSAAVEVAAQKESEEGESHVHSMFQYALLSLHEKSNSYESNQVSSNKRIKASTLVPTEDSKEGCIDTTATLFSF